MTSTNPGRRLTQKFSSKPPEHKATRLRENQRRHRAKVKNRITELEAALATTQSQLHAALERGKELDAEVARLRCALESRQGMPLESENGANISEIINVGSPKGRTGNTDTIQHLLSASGTGSEEGAHILGGTSNQSCLGLSTSVIERTGEDSGPCSERSTCERGNAIEEEVPGNDCLHLPPATPGESTMDCRAAYAIIHEQRGEEIPHEVLKAWLRPGFRRAVVRGSGCRVLTQNLFALVDQIS